MDCLLRTSSFIAIVAEWLLRISRRFARSEIAIEGIKGRLNLMAGVFAVSVLIGVGALGYVANRVNTVAEGVAEMKGQLAGVSQQLASIKAGVEALQSPRQQN